MMDWEAALQIVFVAAFLAIFGSTMIMMYLSNSKLDQAIHEITHHMYASNRSLREASTLKAETVEEIGIMRERIAALEEIVEKYK